MYESYWKLTQQPFQDRPDPNFYFASRTHQSALLKLRYAIEQRKGIGLLVGNHGTGKSYLTHVLEREAHDDGIGPFVRLLIPRLSASETLAYLAGRLGANISDRDTDDRVLTELERTFAKLKEEGHHAVLIVDEAHYLEVSHLNILRMLLNLRESAQADFTIILAGRTDLLAKVKRLAPLDQRICVRTAIEPLDVAEVAEYIEHRVQVAGCDSDLFTNKAAQSIWELSQGLPRKINQICDLALLVGYVDELRAVSPIEIEAAAEEISCVRAA